MEMKFMYVRLMCDSFQMFQPLQGAIFLGLVKSTRVKKTGTVSRTFSFPADRTLRPAIDQVTMPENRMFRTRMPRFVAFRGFPRDARGN